MHYKRPALDLNEFENATYRCSQKVCTNTPRCAKTTARFHREKSARSPYDGCVDKCIKIPDAQKETIRLLTREIANKGNDPHPLHNCNKQMYGCIRGKSCASLNNLSTIFQNI
jgi:hypothetical protein